MQNRILVDDQIASIEVGEGEHADLPIKLCEEHQGELTTKLGAMHTGMLQIVFHALTSSCCRSLGTVVISQFQCPICAMQKFDYIGEMIAIVTSNYTGPAGALKQ
jgi:hypothetical protein